MKHKVVAADVMKNISEPDFNPIVAGPTASATTLTKLNAPLIIPNPSPLTYARICLFSDICALLSSVIFFNPPSALRKILYMMYRNISWKITEKTNPNTSLLRKGTTINHRNDDNNNESNQKNAAAINMIILTGSQAIVNINMARGGPKAKNVQPKNSETVIFSAYYFIMYSTLIT